MIISIGRYGRADLENAACFFSEIAKVLLCHGNSDQACFGLMIYKILITHVPDFVVADLPEILRTGEQIYLGALPCVKVAILTTTTAVAAADLTVFMDFAAETWLGRVAEELLANPKVLVRCLVTMARVAPEFMHARLDVVREAASRLFARRLFDPVFKMMAGYLDCFPAELLPFCRAVAPSLTDTPLTQAARDFYVRYAAAPDFLRPDRACLAGVIAANLEGAGRLVVLELIAKLPALFFMESATLLEPLLAMLDDLSFLVRCAAPAALYNVAIGSSSRTYAGLVELLLQNAMVEPNLHARAAWQCRNHWSRVLGHSMKKRQGKWTPEED
jgi:hypothetical protein